MQLKPITNPIDLRKCYTKTSVAALSLGVASCFLGGIDTALALSTTQQPIELGWDAVPEVGVLGYKIHVGTASGQYTSVIDTGAATTCVLPNLSAGTTFYAAVTATGSTGLESEFSTELAFQTAPALPPLSLHSLQLAWNPVTDSDVAGYRIQMGGSSRNYTKSYDVGAATVFPIADLEFGKTYYFVVSAFGGTGLESETSSELAVKIAPPPLPSGFTLSTTGPSSTGTSITGSPVPCIKWKFPAADLGSSPEFLISESSDLTHWVDVGPISPTQSAASMAGDVEFSWPILVTTDKMFYRMTARNWMGGSVLP